MLEGALVVSQVVVQEEVEPLEEPSLVEGVGHTLMGRPCNKIVEVQKKSFVRVIDTFQQTKEGRQAEVLEALRQEEPESIH